MGQALGRLLSERGFPVAAVACRDAAHCQQAAAFIGPNVIATSYAELPSLAARVLIAVPDDAIAEVAGAMARGGMKEGMALHTSGVHGPEVLQPLADQGVSCATLHPLQTVASREQGLKALKGIFFAIGGDGPAAEWAEEIAGALGGQFQRISPTARPLYHAAAVMASNYLVTLIDAAAKLMEQAGVPRQHVLPAIAPLVEASVRNALAMGPAKALTGPIQRGDAVTIGLHLRALESASPSLLEFYRAAGRRTVDLAQRAGLDDFKARELENLLREAGE